MPSSSSPRAFALRSVMFSRTWLLIPHSGVNQSVTSAEELFCANLVYHFSVFCLHSIFSARNYLRCLRKADCGPRSLRYISAPPLVLDVFSLSFQIQLLSSSTSSYARGISGLLTLGFCFSFLLVRLSQLGRLEES